MTIPEITEIVTTNINKVNEMREKYGNKIKELQDKIEELDNMTGKSQQYIDTQKKKIEREISEITDAMNAKVDELTKRISDWGTQQMTIMSTKLIATLSARFGVPIDLISILKNLKK